MFRDEITLGDELGHALGCAYCGAPATDDHTCNAKREAEEQDEGSKEKGTVTN